MADYFTPICEKAFKSAIEKLPPRIRQNATLVLLEVFFRARRTEGDFEGHELKRGDFAFGEDKLAETCFLTREKIRRVFSHLTRKSVLTIQTTSLGSVGTVIDFDSYVIDHIPNNQPNNQQTTSKQPANNHILKDKREKINDKALTAAPVRTASAARDLDDDSSYEAECYAGWCEIIPAYEAGPAREYPAAYFERLKLAFGEELPVLILHRFIATKGTIDDLDQPDKWEAYMWAMCERNHQNANQENVNNGQHMGGNSRELTFEDIWPELAGGAKGDQ